MNIISWEDFTGRKPLAGKRCAFTIGVFDGIHLGHMALMKRIIGEKDAVPVVITFRQNPHEIFKKDFQGNIYTLNQKLAIMRDIGIDTVILIDFSYEFGKLSGRQFFQKIEESLIPVKVVIGYDFRCGFNNDTGSADIKSMYADSGVNVEVVDEFVYSGCTVKSTFIRSLITEGRLDILSELMYNGYSVDVSGLDSDEIPRNEIKQLLPGSGSYKIKLFRGGSFTDAVINVNNTLVKLEYTKEE